MNPLIIIAIANAILWSGVILALLLYLVQSSRELSAEIDRVERKLTEAGIEELEHFG